MVTHNPYLSEVADTAYRVDQKDGISTIDLINDSLD
jgi:hypothetical protein